MSKRGSQSSKGKLDDQTDDVSETEYYSPLQSEQTIQRGSQAELQKVVQPEKKKPGASTMDTGAKRAQVTVQNQEETDLSSEEPEGCACFINQAGRKVHFDKTKNKFYEQKPFRTNRDQDQNRQGPDTRTMPLVPPSATGAAQCQNFCNQSFSCLLVF
jgi:hypothetical protein